MTADPGLTIRETGDLIAYLFALGYVDGAGDVTAGRRLFMDKKCVACHQLGGTGGVIGPSLDTFRVYGSAISLASAMWNHGPQMTQAVGSQRIERAVLQGGQVRDLIAYLRAGSTAELTSSLYVLPGNAERGAVTFEKNCLACHDSRRIAPRGLDLARRGRDADLAQLAAIMWNKARNVAMAAETSGIQVPRLSAGEMADIVAYLYDIRYFADPGDPRRGRMLATDPGCLSCHVPSPREAKATTEPGQPRGVASPAALVSFGWNHALIIGRAPGPVKGAWQRLNPGELVDLVAYVRGFAGPARPPKGRNVEAP